VRLSCPSCNAEFGLDVAAGRDADAQALAGLLDAAAPQLRGLLIQYLALHRPGVRRLSIARAARLAAELLGDIQRGEIDRKGRSWSAPPAMWARAIEHMLQMRDRGSLTLPLSGHGYLHEVLCGMADQAEAQAERQTEADRRGGRAYVAGATTLADVLGSVVPAAPQAATGTATATAPAPAAPAPTPVNPEAVRGSREAADRIRRQVAERALGAAVAAPAEPIDPPEPR
jgi:hypothetical protein